MLPCTIPTAAFISLKLTLKSTLIPSFPCQPDDKLPNLAAPGAVPAFCTVWVAIGSPGMLFWGGSGLGEEKGNGVLMGKAGLWVFVIKPSGCKCATKLIPL